MLVRDLMAASPDVLLLMSDIVYPAGDINAWRDAVYMPYLGLPSPAWEKTKADWEKKNEGCASVVIPDWKVFASPGNHDWYTVNADGSGLRRVTAFSLNAGDGPDWSSDGKRILFRSPENDDFLHSRLYTIRPDGSGLRQVTHVPDGTTLYSASFSPDGKRITVAMQGVGGAADIYTMKTDGTDITPVTRTAARDSAPDWGGR